MKQAPSHQLGNRVVVEAQQEVTSYFFEQFCVLSKAPDEEHCHQLVEKGQVRGSVLVRASAMQDLPLARVIHLVPVHVDKDFDSLQYGVELSNLTLFDIVNN